MIRSRVVALLVLGSLILPVAGQSIAQVRYVDEKGNSHWVGSEAQVPEQYRDKAGSGEFSKNTHDMKHTWLHHYGGRRLHQRGGRALEGT